MLQFYYLMISRELIPFDIYAHMNELEGYLVLPHPSPLSPIFIFSNQSNQRCQAQLLSLNYIYFYSILSQQ
jgi:hypothetical protein